VGTYTIGEAARRSGFSASALRFYEDIGLVEPSGRTPTGYRLYDDAAVARLAFVARAKQLGCSLEEITDLADIWDGERCGPVQRRFHDLVTTKLRETETQLAALSAFSGQLRTAAERLSGDPVDGPCGPGCACLVRDADVAPAATSVITSGRKADRPPADPLIACTLESEGMAHRVAEWAGVLADATRRIAVDGGVRIEFGPDVDLGDLGRLIGAEQRCCAFFSFSLTVDASGIAMDVQAPEPAAEMITELFGTTARADLPTTASHPG
jgi:MerR family transcriptional regulator, copper efflux regulator